jgi:hypothetical protein
VKTHQSPSVLLPAPHVLEEKLSSRHREYQILNGKDKKKCLEGESNSHLRITQAMLGHMYDRYETFVLAVILSRLDEFSLGVIKYVDYT